MTAPDRTNLIDIAYSAACEYMHKPRFYRGKQMSDGIDLRSCIEAAVDALIATGITTSNESVHEDAPTTPGTETEASP